MGIIDTAIGVALGLALWRATLTLSKHVRKLISTLNRDLKEQKERARREKERIEKRNQLDKLYKRIAIDENLKKKIDKLNKFPYSAYDASNGGKMMRLYKSYYDHVRNEIIKHLEFEDFKYANDLMRMIATRRRKSRD